MRNYAIGEVIMEGRSKWALLFVFFAGALLSGMTYWMGTEMEKEYLREREAFAANYSCPDGHHPAQFYRRGPWNCVIAPTKKKD